MFCVFPSLPNRIIPKREVYAAVDKPLKQTNKQTNTGKKIKIRYDTNSFAVAFTLWEW